MLAMVFVSLAIPVGIVGFITYVEIRNGRRREYYWHNCFNRVARARHGVFLDQKP